jgi:hypothetical protein
VGPTEEEKLEITFDFLAAADVMASGADPGRADRAAPGKESKSFARG